MTPNGRLFGAVRSVMTRVRTLVVDKGQSSGRMEADQLWPALRPAAMPKTPTLTAAPPDQADAPACAIQAVEQRMDAVLAIASHELASPLTALNGSLQMAERCVLRAYEDAAPHQQQPLETLTRLLHLANQQVDRMDRLVADLQDSTRIQGGKLRMCLGPADLVEIVTGVVAEQRFVHPHRVFHVELPERDTVIATVDADRIRQVITNYLTNAVKYTPARQPIEIRLCVTSTMLRVSVRDHGPGLEPAQQKRIWERFQQVHAFHAEGQAVTGLGLGLHISRVIVEQHHGCVGVESAPGQGANFWFDIPCERATPCPEDSVQWSIQQDEQGCVELGRDPSRPRSS